MGSASGCLIYLQSSFFSHNLRWSMIVETLTHESNNYLASSSRFFNTTDRKPRRTILGQCMSSEQWQGWKTRAGLHTGRRHRWCLLSQPEVPSTPTLSPRWLLMCSNRMSWLLAARFGALGLLTALTPMATMVSMMLPFRSQLIIVLRCGDKRKCSP